MPTKGYKTITVTEEVYNELQQKWEGQKNRLTQQGVTNFTGYITQLLFEQIALRGVAERYAPFIEYVDVYEDRIILRDNKRDRIVEVFVREKQLQCALDESTDCVHVGFCFALPRVHEVLAKQGYRPPKVARR